MQPLPILLIQFRTRSVTAAMELQSIERELGDGVQVVSLSALDDTQEWCNPARLLGNYAGVIFGGSGDFDFDGGREPDDFVVETSYRLLEQLRPTLDHIFDHDIPTLGICYGHQIIGAYAGAHVVHDETQTKSRSHKVAVVVDPGTCSICVDVPQTFFAHYGHKDSLDRVPEGAVLVCSGGEGCKVSALRYKQNIYSTQFHPELTLDDMRLRVAATPGYLPEGVCVEEVFADDTAALAILRNFGRLVYDRTVANSL
jgi:GMP synthase (glutamine-hydrolysing)